jgi:N-acetyl-anhydromuramyl-L-alanine amidase AmpD
MVDSIRYGEFKPIGKQKKKSQIILLHSSRNIQSYLLSLKFRLNGKYGKIPNYVITKDGKILQLLKNEEYSSTFSNPNINKHSIIIVLENLGWLQKEPLKDYYVNWIGDIYKGKVFEKKWRDYFFWDPYTEEQLVSTVILVKNLMKEMKIEPNVVGHNTKINGVEKYEGVVTRSNFNSDYTDLSPAFDFEDFLNKINDEQFT